MSLVTCMSCGLESYILCCSDQPFLLSICAACIPNVSNAPNCQLCSKSTQRNFNSVRQRLSAVNPNKNHNYQQYMGNRCFNSNFQAQSYYQMESGYDEVELPPIKQGEHMPQEVFWRYISREGIRRQNACMAERDYEPYLIAERKKNNIHGTPLKPSNNFNWRAQAQFSEDSMSQTSQFQEK